MQLLHKLFEALKLIRIIYTVLMQNRSCFQARSQTFKRGGDKLGYQGHGEGEGACAEAEIITSWACTIISKRIMNL